MFSIFSHAQWPAIALAAALMIAAPSTVQAQDKATPIARGNGVIITEQDLEAVVQQFPLASRQAMLSRPDQIKQLLDGVYIRRMLALQAEAAGTDKDELIASVLRISRERTLSEVRMYDIGKAAWPGDDELERQARAAYDENPTRYNSPERTRARHILIVPEPTDADAVKATERANELLSRLKAGAPFDELARQNSGDQASASRGGDLGYFTPGTMLPDFEQAVAKLTQPGEFAPIIKTQFGLHIIRFEDRQPAGQRNFEQVKAELIGQFRDRAHRAAQQQIVEDLRKGFTLDEAAIKAVAEKYKKQ